MGTIFATVVGTLMEDISHIVEAVFNWLFQNKPNINWYTSALDFQRRGVGFQVYPEPVDILPWDTVFVRIDKFKESEKYYNNKWDTCTLKVLSLDHLPDESNHKHWPQFQLAREFPSVFAKKSLESDGKQIARIKFQESRSQRMQVAKTVNQIYKNKHRSQNIKLH